MRALTGGGTIFDKLRRRLAPLLDNKGLGWGVVNPEARRVDASGVEVQPQRHSRLCCLGGFGVGLAWLWRSYRQLISQHLVASGLALVGFGQNLSH